jgi:NAD(P)-dependent dehydrogenase (short-subunit alcohol dehydrogenase family)
MRAVVIGASGAVGGGLADRLCADGWEVVRLSRSADGLDLDEEASVRAAAGRLQGPFDLIFDATGALEIDGHGPEKTLARVDPAAMARQFAVNAIGPALLLKHFHPLLPRDRRGIFATLSARVGSIGDNRLGGWISYRAAKAALNQIVRTSAIEIARKWPEAVIVALHPGTVRSALTQSYLGRHPAVTPDEAARNLVAVLEALRPEVSGGFFAWDGKAIPW